MKQSELKELANNESLNEAIKEATPHRIKILTDLKSDLKEARKEFFQLMYEGNYNGILSISKKKRKQLTDSEKEQMAETNKKIAKMFTAIKAILYPSKKSNGEKNDPIQTVVDKIALVIQMLEYIGDKSIKEKFAAAGISLDVNKFEEDHLEFADPGLMTRMIGLWTSEIERINSEVCKCSDTIKTDIYDTIDDEVRYSKDNKSGLRTSEFQKLVVNNAYAHIQDSKKYTQHMERQREENKAAIDRNQLMLEKNTNH